ncbi:MAG TPA: RIP metalloprotease RseP [Polyangiaceae bacterium]|nr:RIP metalloprotease RseP [Polyangiaceae bacterium]
MFILVGILGLALLMVVHELGHHIAARAFGMRVIRFSIGFGPAIWRHQPNGSTTIYQVALIPFMAYVQIAGMNPFEDIDPNDKTSYANSSLVARISTIFAGPLANYLFASVLYFAAFMIGGQPIPSLKVDVIPGGAAEKGQMHSGDRILKIDRQELKTWDELPQIVRSSAGRTLSVEVSRQGKSEVLTIVPDRAPEGHGQIGVKPAETEWKPMTLGQSLERSIVAPAQIATFIIMDLTKTITGRKKLSMKDLAGPVGIVGETGKAAKRGVVDFLSLLGLLSTYLGIFNLLPIPALDGGRLVFLGYEAVARRRPNAKVEAQIHAVGLAMLLLLIAVVTVFDIRGH